MNLLTIHITFVILWVGSRGKAIATTNIFSCQTSFATLVVNSDLVYSFSVNGQTWLEDGGVAAHYNGTYFASSAGTLMPGLPRNESGTDKFGSYTSLCVDWTGRGLQYNFSTVFKCYATVAPPTSHPFVAFSTLFPDGATGNISTGTEDNPAGAPNGYNYSTAPIVVSSPITPLLVPIEFSCKAIYLTVALPLLGGEFDVIYK